ncbi:putative hydrolase of the HAD superfamily [Tamilnaduibacter salinus]|uniref:Putative hydrolase of the HAD superfamily n=1 Tax=Tamilnaduibacter salinus TaxID=1484056 RepID=A0A2U1CYS4_9GAMM|nr:GMP/IMP nucleotidase [Tamilnaduibacter salinus]PVY77638.1 putative hydrolase of the HAD superfamily [Tamilnaduibacter salinus]
MIDWASLDTVLLDMDGTLLDLHFDSHFWLDHLPRRYAQIKQLPEQTGYEQIVPLIESEKGRLHWYCTDYWSNRLDVDVVALKREVRDRIGYRPEAEAFLRALHRSGRRTVIVTNCHPDPLTLKLERTGLDRHVDRVLSTHEFGRPKEDRQFWVDLARREPYDPERTLMVDDSLPVLESAADHGIRHLLAILAPDSSQPARHHDGTLPAIHHFDEILPALETVSRNG